MREKSILEAYLQRGTVLTTLCYLLIAAMCLCTVLGIVFSTIELPPATTPFSAQASGSGEPVYLDVVAVSDRVDFFDVAEFRETFLPKTRDDDVLIDVNKAVLYNDGDHPYYIVKAADGSYLIADLSYDLQYKLSEQAADAEPYRVEGYAMPVDGLFVRRGIMEAYGLTEQEYDSIFGLTYLDANRNNPNEKIAVRFFFLLLFLSFPFTVIGTLVFSSKWNYRKSRKYLESCGKWEQAEQQLAAINAPKKKYVLTRDFLYARRQGVVLALDDIGWCYPVRQTGAFIPIEYLRIVTYHLGKYDLNGLSLSDFSPVIRDYPNVLVGLSKENRRTFKERKKGKEFTP